MSQQWDTGYLIGLGITGTLVAAGLGTFIGCGIRALRTEDKYSFAPIASVIGAGVALVAFGIMAFIAWPLDGQYHRYQPLGGTVAQVGSRFIASGTSGGGSTQKFVLTFANGLTLGCNDTRCAQVSKGDDVTLLCERAYQWNAPDPGWDCNWGSDRKPGGVVIP